MSYEIRFPLKASLHIPWLLISSFEENLSVFSLLLFCCPCHKVRRFFYLFTEDPSYNDSVCYQRLCCKIEFAILKKLDKGPSKA